MNGPMAADRIPTLDLRTLDDDPDGFADALGAAYREYGFAGISHHGIPDDLVARAYDAVGAFFALPEEVKRRYAMPETGFARGYTPFGVEHAKDSPRPDLKEFWHVGREVPADHPAAAAYPRNVWPEEVPGFKDATLALYDALESVGLRVLEGVARHLDLAPDFFADKVDHGNSILRPIHYPPIEGAPEGVRSAQHEDINVITLLVGSGEPGLEILRKDGTWIGVDTIPGTIVCNVGDMLQRLTNHVLRSTTHRVVNPPPPWSESSRYSMPFFLHFNAEYVIDTLPGCVSEANPNRYPEPITAQAYLEERLREIGLLADD